MGVGVSDDADSDNLSNNMKYPRKIFSIAHEIIPPISSWRLGPAPGQRSCKLYNVHKIVRLLESCKIIHFSVKNICQKSRNAFNFLCDYLN